MSSLNTQAISYTGADAAEAAAALDAAIASLDFPAEVVCVALASHEGLLHGVATVRLVEIVAPDALHVEAADSASDVEPGIDDLAGVGRL